MKIGAASDLVADLARELRRERERATGLREVLNQAADRFASYADGHLAKVPPDREKAATNVEWAARCRDAAKVPDTVR